MHIELLWIIPIVAFGFFIFLVAFLAQRRADNHDELSKQVASYNNGSIDDRRSRKESDGRLGEIENAISLMTHSLSNQQKMIEQFQKENNSYNSEINELRKKLRELHKEYDIVLSENYSLRAKVKKLVNDSDQPAKERIDEDKAGKVNMKLYDDTRLLNVSTLEDTSEIDLSDSR